MPRTSPALLALAALAAAAPRAASAHGVRAEVDRRGGAVAVRALYHGDRPLAGARWEARSPRGGDAPFAEGETDRHGWLAFTPDVAGTWTVRIADATGHGKTVEVEVAEVPGAAADAAPAGAAPSPAVAIELAPAGAARPEPEPAPGGGGHALRVVAGLTAIVVVFRLLLAVQRARRGRVR